MLKRILLLFSFFIFLFYQPAYALDIPGDPSDFGGFSDAKCGIVHQFDPEGTIGSCQTKGTLEGQRVEQVVTNPDGTQTRTPTPYVQFDPLDAASGNDALIPTGKEDLEQWLGKSSTGEEISADTSCDDIIKKVFSTSSPGDMHTGIYARLLSPTDWIFKSADFFCNLTKKAYLEKSLGQVNLEAPSGTDNLCVKNTKQAQIALPTYGPTLLANLIHRQTRSVNYEQMEEYALEQLKTYILDHGPGATTTFSPTDPRVASASIVAQATPALPDDPIPAPSPAPTPVSTPTYIDPKRCLEGDCDTVKEEDDRICFMSTQNNPAERTLSLGQIPLANEEYPVDITIQDPALGGGVLGEETTPTGPERILDLITTANYFVFSLTAGPIELMNKLWDTERFGTGEGEAWQFNNVEAKGNRTFGTGHLVALQASSCRATSTPTSTEECGDVIEVLEGAATSMKRPGIDFQPEKQPISNPATGQPYSPGFSNPECKACEIKPSSGISQKLIDVLNEAGSAFDVPANILLGIIRLEGLHRGAAPAGYNAVYEYSDADIEKSITDQDPYCVRNEACAMGPFQFLTNPAEHKSEIYHQFGGGCTSWPGNTKSGDWDIWGSFTDKASFQKILGKSNPNPCNLRDAAFAAAAHVRSRVEYRNASINATSTCADWDANSARDGWFTYQGSCANNYCTTAASFLSNVCVDSSIVQPKGSNTPTPQ